MDKIEIILRAIHSENTIAKHIADFSWDSDSRTVVSPITFGEDDVRLQMDTSRRLFDKAIKRTLAAYPHLFRTGYFCKNDGSCPAEIRFTYTDETREEVKKINEQTDMPMRKE